MITEAMDVGDGGETALSPVPNPVEQAGARRVARNSLVPFGANLVARLLSWAMAIVMARQLGPEGVGAYYLAANLWLYASIVADFGLGTWLTREIARSPESARTALRETLGTRLALSLLAIPTLIGIAAVSPASRSHPEIVATAGLLGLGLLPGAVSAAGTALFTAHERMVFPAMVQLVSAVLTTGAGAALLWLGYGIVSLGAVSLGVNVVTATIFAIACTRTFFPIGATAHLRRQLDVARDALPLMFNNLLNTVFFRIDVQILQGKGSAAVGQYANAYKVIDAAGTVPSSFVLALFPMLSRRAAAESGERNGDGGLSRVYRLALKLLIAVALPLALLVTFGASDITLWFAGPDFLPDSATALRILIWFLPLSFFNGLTQYVLIATGLQRRITVAFAVTAVFNLVANLVLIPRYSFVAAAFVTIASECVLLVPFLMALRSKLAIDPILGAALRPVPAAVLAGILLWGTASWSRPLAVVVTCLAYPALLLGTMAFDAAERCVLLSLVPRRR